MSDEEAKKQARLESSRRYQAKNREYYREKRKRFMGAHPEKASEYAKNYRAKHGEEINARRRERRRLTGRVRYQQSRQQILDLLGGQCAVCNIADHRVLQIDHINGDGAAERKTYKWTNTLYKRIRESIQHGEMKYQLLCANCHVIKHGNY